MTINNIELVLKDIEKQFGAGAAQILTSQNTLNIKRVPSGSLNLDLALGGGVPIGRIIEMYGQN